MYDGVGPLWIRVNEYYERTSEAAVGEQAMCARDGRALERVDGRAVEALECRRA